jgi:apolipoprotein N-acyltransferase
MGARQHFLMGNMRAIETRRYLLRVGNDGITALVDPLGQVVTELPRAIQDTLLVNYNLRRGRTLYVRFGDWLIVVLVIVAVILSLRGRTSRGAFI